MPAKLATKAKDALRNDLAVQHEKMAADAAMMEAGGGCNTQGGVQNIRFVCLIVFWDGCFCLAIT